MPLYVQSPLTICSADVVHAGASRYDGLLACRRPRNIDVQALPRNSALGAPPIRLDISMGAGSVDGRHILAQGGRLRVLVFGLAFCVCISHWKHSYHGVRWLDDRRA